ncbi:MAG: GIY-YIG nuclease family protein [Candidatus Liptonbacteria bacterium]|nr:GIY-YIG nuclease family protein [Candidatus Liptonbacteria bacterium]
MNNWQKVKDVIKKAPKTTGVYVFYEKRTPIYVGKASNLKNRLHSYLKESDLKNSRLRENATELKLVPLRSEIEALIEEAKLIKKYNPPYNVIWRDDKSYFYAVFTVDEFPKILVAHKNQLQNATYKPRTGSVVGPFTEGRALRLVLRMLRRYFPYCTCPKQHLRDCLNSQIGNCYGFCCKKNVLQRKQLSRYKKNIEVIKNVLLGKNPENFGKNLKPEEKSALDKILAHREYLENFDSLPADREMPAAAYLVEGYDVSHLSGKETVAGMTAWLFSGTDGKGVLSPRKDFWRKFIIRTAKPGDDTAAMAETISRRLRHPEWPYPGLMIIDGGKGQLAAAKSSLSKTGTGGIKMISFAKPEKTIYGLEKKGVKIENASDELKKIIPAVVSQTHDFAVRFHRHRRKNSFLGREN